MKLAEVQRRRIKRLLILEPPRHGKSELVSKYFPAWWLGKSPEDSVLLSSYSDRFAKTWGRRARDVFQEWGPKVFDLYLRGGQSATEDWGIAGHGGTMATAGIGGSIVGRGADLLIIDDPIKDQVAAQSQLVRDNIWDWWVSTASTRLAPDGVVVIVMTHWHQDDLAGRLMKEMADGGEQWEVIRMPAIAEEDETWSVGGWSWTRKKGEALWPARWTLEKLHAIKKRSARWWAALYQQRPVPPSGYLAERAWFPLVAAMPAPPLLKVRFWDCAGTDGLKRKREASDPDWTVGALLARDGERFYIEDIIRVRKTPAEVNKLIYETAKLDGVEVAIREEMEGGSSGGAIISARRNMLVGYHYVGVRATGSKEANWQPMFNQAEAGNILMLKNARWNKDFLDEVDVAGSTGGEVHDDQLDAVSGAFKALALETQASLAAGAQYPLYY